MDLNQEMKMALAAISENVDAQEFDVLITEAGEQMANNSGMAMDEAITMAAVELSDAGVISETTYNVTDAVMESFGENALISALQESVDADTFEAIVNEAGAMISETGCSITEAVMTVVDEASLKEIGSGLVNADLSPALKKMKEALSKTNLGKAYAANKSAREYDKKANEYNNEANRTSKFAKETRANAVANADAAKLLKSTGNSNDATKFYHLAGRMGNKADALDKQAENFRANRDQFTGSAKKARGERNKNLAIAGAKGLAGAAVIGGAATAYHDYKKHGDALYRVHRMQEKRAQRKALKAGNADAPAANEAANAIAYLMECGQ